MIFDIIITIFLVLLNGFFVAAEFAIVKVRSSQLDSNAAMTDAVVKSAKSILAKLDSYLAATQLGVTLASLGLGWIGEDVVTEILLQLFHSLNLPLSAHVARQIALPVAFILITVLHIVFGELAPKSIAIRYPASTSIFISLPLKIFYSIFKPFIWLLNGCANGLLRLLGIQPATEDETFSEEEIKLIIADSHRRGSIDETESRLIHRVFDFDAMKAVDVKTHRKRVSSLSANTDIKEAAQFMLEEGFSRYPMVSPDATSRVLGLVYTKDVLKALHEGITGTIDKLSRLAYFIPENMPVNKLLPELQRKRMQMAIVVDEFGAYTGIVTMEDILEELVGEIQDEYDNESSPVEKIGHDLFLVDAQQTIADVNKYIPIPLETGDDYLTLSGMIVKLTGRFPERAERIETTHYSIKIHRIGNKTIESALLRLKQVSADSDTERPAD